MKILDAWITRVTEDGRAIWITRAPHMHYPWDARMANDGNIIVDDFVKPGGMAIFNPLTAKIA